MGVKHARNVATPVSKETNPFSHKAYSRFVPALARVISETDPKWVARVGIFVASTLESSHAVLSPYTNR